jgi:hypothetical protein
MVGTEPVLLWHEAGALWKAVVHNGAGVMLCSDNVHSAARVAFALGLKPVGLGQHLHPALGPVPRSWTDSGLYTIPLPT